MANSRRAELEAPTVAVFGLGYVRLPLALDLCKKCRTIGYDLSENKVDAYPRHIDPTAEVATESLKATTKLEATTDPRRLSIADYLIVAVLTPVNEALGESPSGPAQCPLDAYVSKHG